MNNNYTAHAILKNKRVQPNQNGKYVVDVECSHCSHLMTVTFSGWSAIGCSSCRVELDRTPYRATAQCAPEIDREPCADCSKTVWYCNAEEQWFHEDPNHECFLASGKAPATARH